MAYVIIKVGGSMKYPKLTIPTAADVFGDGINGPLDVFQKYGVFAAGTDLSRITGGRCELKMYSVDTETGEYIPTPGTGQCVPDDESLRGLKCEYLTKTSEDGEFVVVSTSGVDTRSPSGIMHLAIRPVIEDPELFDLLLPYSREGYNGTREVDCGAHALYAASSQMQKKLENYYLTTYPIEEEPETYTLISNNLCSRTTNDAIEFNKTTQSVYEYQGKKYVRAKVYPVLGGTYLTNGKHTDEVGTGINSYVWLEVTPYTWLMDIATKKLIGKVCLSACGKPYKDSKLFKSNKERYDGHFESTEIYSYLNNELVHDLFQSEPLFQKKEASKASLSDRKGILQTIKDKLTPNNPLAALHEDELRILFHKIISMDSLDPKREEFMIRICDAQNFYNAFYKDINTQTHEKKLEFEELCRQLGYDIDRYINNIDDDEPKKRAI